MHILTLADPFTGAGDALSYVWIGPNKASVTSVGGSTTPSGGQLIKAAPATANRVYTNSNNGLTYSSPDIHTVPLRKTSMLRWSGLGSGFGSSWGQDQGEDQRSNTCLCAAFNTKAQHGPITCLQFAVQRGLQIILTVLQRALTHAPHVSHPMQNWHACRASLRSQGNVRRQRLPTFQPCCCTSQVTVSGLTPGTTYYYKVGDPAKGVSAVFSFKVCELWPTL